MNRLILGAAGCVALASPAMALGKPPPDTQSNAALVFLLCSVSDQGLSKNCRFYTPIDAPSERLKAGTELGFLDAHPFPISGARPGADVKVLVRLNVSADKSGQGFEVAAPAGVFQASSASEVRDLVWINSPHASWTGGFVPDLARRMNQRGEATVRCMATQAGALANCWVEKETPTDFGFGEAALLLLQHARMQPVSAGGSSVAGRTYVQTFRYDAGPGMSGHGSLWSATAPGGSMTSMMMGNMK